MARVTVGEFAMVEADHGGVVGRDEEEGVSWLAAGGVGWDMLLIG